MALRRVHRGNGLGRPRRWVFRRDDTGRILDVRLATDPLISDAWLRDPEVRRLFAAHDRAYDLAHGLRPGDDQEQAAPVEGEHKVNK